MALVITTNATEGLNMLTGTQFLFDAQDPGGTNSVNSYSWLTAAGDDVQASGSGITWSSPGGDPLTGTITSIDFDFNDDNFAAPDVEITGFSGDLVAMTTGNDLLDEVFGGNDTINGTDFNDYLKGVAGNDSILGNNGADTLIGGDGNDTLRGGLGADSLFGGNDNDLLIEDGLNTDTVNGGNGNDTIRPTSELAGINASWNGGADTDWFDVSDLSNAGKEVDLLNGRWEVTPGNLNFEDAIGFENVDGGTGAETLRGSNDANRLYGNNGNDTIFGNGDSDTLRGGAGDDSIRGGSENDYIRGDAGADYLAGDAGNDRFEYYAGTTTGADSVFGNAGTDTIWLSGAATFDFQTQGVQFSQLEEIEFRGDGGSIAKTLIVTGDEMNDGFVDGLLIDGNGNITSLDTVRINMTGDTTLDMSAWTFQDWTDQYDRLQVYGDASSEDIYASSRSDSIRGGEGNDDFFMTTTGVVNDTLIGDGGTDRVLFNSAGTFDMTSAEFNTIEEFEFNSAGGTTLILAAEELNNTYEPDDVLIDGYNLGGATDNVDEIQVNLVSTSSLDLSAWTFQDWNQNNEERILITGDGSAETITATTQDDEVYSNDGQDNIATGGGDDTIDAGDGNDTVDAGANDDYVIGGGGDDSLDGGTGNDTVDFSGTSIGMNIDLVAGTAIVPAFFTENAENFENVMAGTGNDTVMGTTDDNIIDGNNGDDSITGDQGGDTLTGGDGADTLIGGEGKDSLDGGIGADLMNGGVGADTFIGGDGDDEINAGDSNDSVVGGEGDDFLKGQFQQDTMQGGAGNDTLNGADGGDLLAGGIDNDLVQGGIGSDTLYGGNGDDTIRGQQQADTINGGNGNDLLEGGQAGDDFIFSGSFGDDTITDFDMLNTEDIDLSGVADITDFTDLVNNHLSNSGGDALITSSSGSILLEGVAFADVGVGQDYSDLDFLF